MQRTRDSFFDVLCLRRLTEKLSSIVHVSRFLVLILSAMNSILFPHNEGGLTAWLLQLLRCVYAICYH